MPQVKIQRHARYYEEEVTYANANTAMHARYYEEKVTYANANTAVHARYYEEEGTYEKEKKEKGKMFIQIKNT